MIQYYPHRKDAYVQKHKQTNITIGIQKMKKLAIAIAMILSAPALAESDAATISAEQSSAANISDLSSTADKPNNLYDFIENDKLSGVAYAGAELGGNVLFDDQADGNFDQTYMFKVGADLSYSVTDSFSILMGGEARYAWSGLDTKSRSDKLCRPLCIWY